jgi:SH3 domain-containing YSC84-like protein 1
MKLSKLLIPVAIILLAIFSQGAFAQDTPPPTDPKTAQPETKPTEPEKGVTRSDPKAYQPDEKKIDEGRKRADSASRVIIQIMGNGDRSIPHDLLQKANAVVVFPGVLKGAFVVGGQGGKGLVVRRTKDGWSAPAFLKMAGGSIGPQIGGSKIDYIMLIMNEGGLKGLLQDKFEMGGEASVSAGPIGRNAAASTNATLDAQILTYSRSKGAFIGVSLKGAVITQDDDLNRGIYGKTAKDLLLRDVVMADQAPEDLQGFPRMVQRFSK